VDGDFYINTVANTIFGPKAAGVWGSGTSIVDHREHRGIRDRRESRVPKVTREIQGQRAAGCSRTCRSPGTTG